MEIDQLKKIAIKYSPDEYFLHIYFVYKIAMDLHRVYGGNKKVIAAAALLHDIGFHLDRENHEIVGAQLATSELKRLKFKAQDIAQIADCIIAHNAKQHKPKTIEEKIVSSSDAASKVLYAPLFGLLSNKPPRQKSAWVLKYIDKSYKKICLPQFKKRIKKTYLQMRDLYQISIREEEKLKD
ncbi:MAG: HD domain-containing protein [Parcubacteria group bacterium]